MRQIAVKNIGRDHPTLLITNDPATPAKDLFARYAERMTVENELDAYISGFHLDALTSGVPLNVDLDTTLTVLAGNLYRLLALKLDRYENATPDKIWRHFLEHHRHPAHHRNQRHLRTEPAQPPPGPHRRRLRRPRSTHPLVGGPHPAVPVSTTIITRPQGTSTQLPDRESRLSVIPQPHHFSPGAGQAAMAAVRARPASRATACAASFICAASSVNWSRAGSTPTSVNSRSTTVSSAPHTSARIRRR